MDQRRLLLDRRRTIQLIFIGTHKIDATTIPVSYIVSPYMRNNQEFNSAIWISTMYLFGSASRIAHAHTIQSYQQKKEYIKEPHRTNANQFFFLPLISPLYHFLLEPLRFFFAFVIKYVALFNIIHFRSHICNVCELWITNFI